MSLRGIWSITKTELRGLFTSPVALLFVGMFLVVNLFIFFTHSRFFLRGVADVRPLFEWIPLLLIFLGSAVSMRAWSEESRSGTLELLLTLPVSSATLVLGKFCACLALVTLALGCTLSIPFTVADLGPLDVGPVWGGYIASLLLGAAYLSVGLFVSAVSENQIVSLMLSVALCGLLYFIGSDALLAFVGQDWSETLSALGTGARFDSIERGVLDIRDLVYLTSITIIGLYLNVLAVERRRIELRPADRPSRWRGALFTALLVAGNLGFANLHINRADLGRIDLTEERLFSVSEVTRQTLMSLDEPVRITGYFSRMSDPQLNQVIPRIRDLLREYEEVGGDQVQLSFVTPEDDEESIRELEESYQIKPYSVTLASRAKLVSENIYFHVLVQYGDAYKVVQFWDLMERDPLGDELRLKGIEYVMTNTIKTVSRAFSSLETLMASKQVKITAYVSAARRFGPNVEKLRVLPERVSAELKQLKQRAEANGGSITVQMIDPITLDMVAQQNLREQHGFKPIALGDGQPHWIYALVEVGARVERVTFPPLAEPKEIKTRLESAIRQSASGFSKVVGIVTQAKSEAHPNMPYGMAAPKPKVDYQWLKAKLGDQFQVRHIGLGRQLLSNEIDALIIAKIGALTADQRLIIDQYLMSGGSVIALAGEREVELDWSRSQGRRIPPEFKATSLETNLSMLLARYGVEVGAGYVADERGPEILYPQLDQFNRPSLAQKPYPYFVNIPAERLKTSKHPALAGLSALSMMWASPISLNDQLSPEVRGETLFSSSERGWLSEAEDLSPSAAPADQARRATPLAVALSGTFKSAFAGEKPSSPAEGEDPKDPLFQRLTLRGQLLDTSVSTARLAVIGSSDFVSDMTLGELLPYYKNHLMINLDDRSGILFIKNLIEWATADTSLASLRKMGPASRLIRPLSDTERFELERANYLFALLSLIVISALVILPRRFRRYAA